jgi:DNA-binding NtrC family response regulator
LWRTDCFLVRDAEQIFESVLFCDKYHLEKDKNVEHSLQTFETRQDAQLGEWIPVQRLSERTENVGDMVVVSEELRKVLRTITKLSPYRQTVLVEGESGTGKDLIARALHNFSGAPSGPFVTFNCSNLVASLAEAQLFGHVKGAYTDAREDALGYFRSANGGTLFLDEIGELPLNLQPKLLRAVENREVQAVGSSHVFKVDLRLIAATNRDLRGMMKKGEFREDLYYRLNSASINVPPLRKRAEAIPNFIAHFVERYNKLFGKSIQFVSQDALAAMCKYPWPGNIRELAHVIETAVLMTELDRLTVSDLPAQILTVPTDPDAPMPAPAPFGDPAVARLLNPSAQPIVDQNWSLPDKSPLLLDDVIKKTLLRSLQQSGGNRRRAADLLGVSRSTLYRMLARYELDDTGRPPPITTGFAI